MYMHVSACMCLYARHSREVKAAGIHLPERAGVGSIPVVYVVPLPHILGKLQLVQLALQAWSAPCSTSTLGPWSGPMTTRPVPPKKLV